MNRVDLGPKVDEAFAELIDAESKALSLVALHKVACESEDVSNEQLVNLENELNQARVRYSKASYRYRELRAVTAAAKVFRELVELGEYWFKDYEKGLVKLEDSAPSPFEMGVQERLGDWLHSVWKKNC